MSLKQNLMRPCDLKTAEDVPAEEIAVEVLPMGKVSVEIKNHSQLNARIGSASVAWQAGMYPDGIASSAVPTWRFADILRLL